ncbi:hypothetical protein [Streptomyces sp. SID161]|uniref:hypothetical protein n=1 Tax=Streptomyces sp. SID161 TaxID=2690251 RepID=UPI0013720EF3|nr:hypothetical protein [Streptomyces sp. SID161]MYW48873.1 hypothetical protein [Streptomyces sp. SID161]MYW49842.1 hypothetical protein [Streptomyces sp. SID161]
MIGPIMRLPVYLQVGSSAAPIEAGWVEIEVGDTGASIRAAVAAVLRAAADGLEHLPADDEEASDAAAHR